MNITRESELWLQQFEADELETATELVRRFKFVGAAEFTFDLTHLIANAFGKDEVVALFVEREIKSKAGGDPIKMYDEQELPRGLGLPKRRRAVGAARPAVQSQRNDKQSVGSEGIVANIVSKLAIRYPKRFLVQPSADAIRKHKPRHIVIVTDFIGSGRRVRRFLSSLWAVRSIRSWNSYKLVKFSICSYSATRKGVIAIEGHPCSAKVRMVAACPTIDSSFAGEAGAAIATLCFKYAPHGSDPMGYKDTGALMAFAHSCPNNVPAIFRVSSRSPTRWNALFESGSTIDLAFELEGGFDKVQLGLEALDYENIALRSAFKNASRAQKHVILLLAAVRRGRRHLEQITTITGFGIREIVQSEQAAIDQKLLTPQFRLTSDGFSLLRRLNVPPRTTKILPVENQAGYYPSALRVPK